MLFFHRRYQLQAACISHPGRVRGNNEDAAWLMGKIKEDPDQPEFASVWSGVSLRFLAAVADGMGGEACGEIASMEAVKNLQPAAFPGIRARAVADIAAANEVICREMEAQGSRMGSTFAALYLDGDRGLAVNVGDSRVYLLRDGIFTQLSTDHDRAAQMVRQGMLTKEEAAKHPARHSLTQHLGIDPEEFVIEPAFSEVTGLREGDIFLLCSDGLSDMVPDERIREILVGGDKAGGNAAGGNENNAWNENGAGNESRAALACLALRDAALAAGGRDNVTVLTVFVEGAEA